MISLESAVVWELLGAEARGGEEEGGEGRK